MTNPKRYFLDIAKLAGVTEHPEGEFVRYEDYKKLSELWEDACKQMSGTHEPRTDTIHDITCNYRGQPLGSPGCICKVVNKHDYAAMEQELAARAPVVEPSGGVPGFTTGDVRLKNTHPEMHPRVYRGNGAHCLGCGKGLHEHLTNYNFCPGLPTDDRPVVNRS